MGKKVYEDDDQRVIADMSDVSHSAPRFHARTQSISDVSDSQPKQSPFSSEERRLYVFADRTRLSRWLGVGHLADYSFITKKPDRNQLCV